MDINYIRKINKIIGIVFTASTILFALIFIAGLAQTDYGLLIVMVLATLAYWVMRKDDEKQNLLKKVNYLLIALLGVYSVYAGPNNGPVTVVLIIALLSLYFDKSVPLVATPIYIVAYVMSATVLNTKYFGGDPDDILISSVVMLFAGIVIFFICKFGLENIKNAQKSQEASNQLVKDLEGTLSVIKENTKIL